MIERKEFLDLVFYKKCPFYGSYKNMHYKIEKIEVEKEEGTQKSFKVTYWPGPYNYQTTTDDLKKAETFPFSEEGLEEVAKFLNEQYENQKELWDSVEIR